MSDEIFQSTRPGWGGTCGRKKLLRLLPISIHPPRVGRDAVTLAASSCMENFNPPAPGGAGRQNDEVLDVCKGISIHPPRVGRDFFHKSYLPSMYISIHPPRVGRDLLPSSAASGRRDFNPPAPGGAGQPEWVSGKSNC